MKSLLPITVSLLLSFSVSAGSAPKPWVMAATPVTSKELAEAHEKFSANKDRTSKELGASFLKTIAGTTSAFVLSSVSGHFNQEALKSASGAVERLRAESGYPGGIYADRGTNKIMDQVFDGPHGRAIEIHEDGLTDLEKTAKKFTRSRFTSDPTVNHLDGLFGRRLDGYHDWQAAQIGKAVVGHHEGLAKTFDKIIKEAPDRETKVTLKLVKANVLKDFEKNRRISRSLRGLGVAAGVGALINLGMIGKLSITGEPENTYYPEVAIPARLIKEGIIGQGALPWDAPQKPKGAVKSGEK